MILWFCIVEMYVGRRRGGGEEGKEREEERKTKGIKEEDEDR